jgi:site-specific recombinase XerC
VALAPEGALYRHLGMDRANVRRERLAQTAPRALRQARRVPGVPLNALVRATITEWLECRPALAGETEQALFVSRGRRRLSARAADASGRRVARDAGLEVSARGLRTRA